MSYERVILEQELRLNETLAEDLRQNAIARTEALLETLKSGPPVSTYAYVRLADLSQAVQAHGIYRQAADRLRRDAEPQR